MIGGGLAGLALVAGLFAAGKVAFWRSVVVHEEPSSIHRLFPGGILVRFPQEPSNVADFLTGTFLLVAGVLAFVTAFAISERLRGGRAWRPADACAVRNFFALAGAGFVWLGIDEVFLVHELLSANLFVSDAGILAVYAAAGLAACLRFQRVLRTSWLGLGTLVFGAVLHGSALALDFFQHRLGWVPEEPLEMLAAGFYALGIATYAARLLLSEPARGEAGRGDAGRAGAGLFGERRARGAGAAEAAGATNAPAAAAGGGTAASMPSDPAWTSATEPLPPS